MGNISFRTLDKDGTVTNVRLIKQSDIQKCPLFILVPEHYKADGSCKCFDKAEQARILAERLARRAKTVAAIARQKGGK